MDVDVVIVGGGIAGLWTLSQLRKEGLRAILVENRALGTGQTVSSQGIIHGGLKYSLKGILSASADEIREMPGIWRDCLAGQRKPNLSRVTVRSHSCYLWQTSAISSQAGMLAAQLSLRVKPEVIPPHQRPELLREANGNIYRLGEQVLSPTSLVDCFRQQFADLLFQIDEQQGLQFENNSEKQVTAVRLVHKGRDLLVNCKAVVLTAGAGNQELTQQVSQKHPMQRRPLHMVMARGTLPSFQGHCIDGAQTRLTITSECLDRNRTIWQLGGQIAEQGVNSSPEDLVRHAVAELKATLPSIDVDSLEFATYRIDRAERKSRLGMRPDSPQIQRVQNVITCWPTKLAFAPRVAEKIAHLLKSELQIPGVNPDWAPARPADWTIPAVAQAPWEQDLTWYNSAGMPQETPLAKAG